jgi:hypothetical protein
MQERTLALTHPRTFRLSSVRGPTRSRHVCRMAHHTLHLTESSNGDNTPPFQLRNEDLCWATLAYSQPELQVTIERTGTTQPGACSGPKFNLRVAGASYFLPYGGPA